MMRIIWDEKKSEANVAQGRLPFDAARPLLLDNTLPKYAAETVGEERYVVFGEVQGKLHMVVFTPRPPDLRIISFRRLSDKEFEKWILRLTKVK